jgi:hypothetical protein
MTEPVRGKQQNLISRLKTLAIQRRTSLMSRVVTIQKEMIERECLEAYALLSGPEAVNNNLILYIGENGNGTLLVKPEDSSRENIVISHVKKEVVGVFEESMSKLRADDLDGTDAKYSKDIQYYVHINSTKTIIMSAGIWDNNDKYAEMTQMFLRLKKKSTPEK